MIKSGSAKILIWESDSPPDLSLPAWDSFSEIEPEYQKDPLVLRINQSSHKILTDDSTTPRLKQTGLVIEATVSLLGDLSLFDLGLISSPEASGNRLKLSQSAGASFPTCSILILPVPIFEQDPQWRDSSVFITNCQIHSPENSNEFGISSQRSWELKIVSTYDSDLFLGLGDWNLPSLSGFDFSLENNDSILLG